jgi:uncharacterized protein
LVIQNPVILKTILIFIAGLYLFLMPINADAQSSSLVQAVPSALKTLSFRLRPGQDLKQEIQRIAETHQIRAGAVLTCVGSLTDLTLRLANQDGPTVWHGHFEMQALSGTVSTNGSHLHLSAADSTGRTLGGHLLDGCKVYTTAEIVLGILPDVTFVREPDPTFGYRELVVKKQ